MALSRGFSLTFILTILSFFFILSTVFAVGTTSHLSLTHSCAIMGDEKTKGGLLSGPFLTHFSTRFSSFTPKTWGRPPASMRATVPFSSRRLIIWLT